MPGERRLWTGPFGAPLRERLLAHPAAEAAQTWVVPSALARDRWNRELTLRRRLAIGLRVWCWDDAWRSVASGRADAPARLSAAGARAVVGEAISRERRARRLNAVRAVADAPGFRRRLRGRFAAWTAAERRPSVE